METEVTSDREDGELSDNDEGYTPLERPPQYSAIISNKNRFSKVLESESEEEKESSSDSDSDFESKRKKLNKPKLRKPSAISAPKRKKYDIWSTRIQEDVLSETLNSCDVSLKDRSRDVESYDYTLSYRYKNSLENGKALETNLDERTNNKRSRNDRKNPNLRLKNVKNASDEDSEKKGAPRFLLELNVNEGDSTDEIVRDIANKLCEEKEDLIRTIVDEIGAKKAIEIFKNVQKIEAEGGMMIMNQTRRRTPGGIYFFLVKHDDDLTKEQHKKIFNTNSEQFKMELKEKKKKRRQEIKAQLLEERKKKEKSLPELLTKAELCVQELASNSDRSRKNSTNVEDVINPPPTPETIENEYSTDGSEHVLNKNDSLHERKLDNYEEDFLDINAGTEMDLF